jgi:hypothetical protein
MALNLASVQILKGYEGLSATIGKDEAFMEPEKTHAPCGGFRSDERATPPQDHDSMAFAPMSQSAEHAKNALGAHHDPFAITSWNLDDMGVSRHVVWSLITCLHSIRDSCALQLNNLLEGAKKLFPCLLATDQR